MTTIAESMYQAGKSVEEVEGVGYMTWLIGVGMLLTTLILLSLLGHLQGVTYRTYHSSSQEGMFYSHFLPLPLFFFLAGDISSHVKVWNASEIVEFLGIGVPSLWVLLVLNLVTQYACSSGLHGVTGLDV